MVLLLVSSLQACSVTMVLGHLKQLIREQLLIADVFTHHHIVSGDIHTSTVRIAHEL